MRKNKFVFLVMSVMLVLTMLLSACGGGDALKGTWSGQSQDMSVTWKFDGKGGCELENEYGMKDTGTYTIDGSGVQIKMSYWEKALDYKFTLDDDKLSLVAEEEYRPSYELEKK